jgi:hypothetical protein
LTHAGEVVQEDEVVASLMADTALLHGLGIRLVVVLGAHPQIDAALEERGSSSLFVGGYRVTCAVALEAAVEAAGRSRTAVERYLSRGPSVPVFRRHSKGESDEMHFGARARLCVGLRVGLRVVWGVCYTAAVRARARVCVCVCVCVWWTWDASVLARQPATMRRLTGGGGGVGPCCPRHNQRRARAQRGQRQLRGRQAARRARRR